METIRATSESMKTSVEKTLFKHKEETCREMEQTKEDAIGIITKTSENMKNSIEINISKHQEEACTVIEQQKKDAIENITASAERLFSKVDSSESIIYNRIDKVEEKLANTAEDMNEMKNMCSMQLEDSTYTKAKEDFQRSLVEMYLENVVKVSPVLLHPERTDTVISQLYVDPYLEIEPREKGNTQEKTRVSSYTEVFEKDGKPLKLIYLIGEAGSGKSTFCIDMIHKWCLAHSEQRTQESESVQFMKKFKFLFYIYLRHNIDADHIETMIRNHYEDGVLESILAKEAGDCLILLDGLDEWTTTEQQRTVSQFQTKGLPRRDLRKKYTVITTTRPWKFESLSIKGTEFHQILRIRGVYNVDEMARKTINQLNEMFKTSKNVADFDRDLSKCSFEDDIKRMPMVLQQLVCLWFDGKLKQFGKCEIYSNMVSLYFEWADSRNPDDQVLKNLKEKSIRLRDVILPNQCIRTELCEEHTYVIHHVGRLAYETLFSEEKELSLSFNESTFRRHEIPEEVIQCCLIVGLLSKEREVGLSLSRRKHVSFSFNHKSLQEFFAAVFLYIEIKQRSPQMFKMYTIDTIDDNIKCLQDFLCRCKTVTDILVQSNIIIFLCGFDPFLAAHVSKFLYNITHEDGEFNAFRTNIKYEPFEVRLPIFAPVKIIGFDYHGHSADLLGIQNLLLSCIREAIVPEGKTEQLYFLQDIVYKKSLFPEQKNMEMIKYVKAGYVSSLSLELSESEIPKILFDILNDPDIGRHLSTLKIKFSGPVDGEAARILLKLFVNSTIALKCLFLKSRPGFYYFVWMRQFFHFVMKMLPNLQNLISLKLECITLSYSEIMDLCRFLTKANYLRQISLRQITDNPDPNVWYPDYPKIDLSKHCQLQILDHDYRAIELLYFNVLSLKTCAMCLPYFSNIRTAFNMLKKSQFLNEIHILGNQFGSDKSVNKVTKQFRKLLPFLNCLTTLQLEEFYFSETIIASPLEMKNLRTIIFTNVKMDVNVWKSFIESVLAVPQNVNMKVSNESNIAHNMFRAASKLESRLHNLKPYGTLYGYLMFNSKHDVDI